MAYVMYTDVFSLDSKTAHFNRAFDQVRKDERCIDLLGNSKKIVAYGEPTANKWRRARPIAYVESMFARIIRIFQRRGNNGFSDRKFRISEQLKQFRSFFLVLVLTILQVERQEGSARY